MAEASTQAGGGAPDAAWEAVKLLRAARAATLATSAGGQPFASLVTPATAPDRSVLLFLSSLSEHTRHLMADPRCSLLAAGPPEGPNPQTAPRVTLTGTARPVEDAALKRRWLALHPYAALYADFADFGLWRLTPRAGLYVGGFARAVRLREGALTADAAAVAAVEAAAAAIVAHCNTDHADAINAIAGAPGDWTMVAVDCDGCDLARGETVRRIAWSAPVGGPEEVRRELVRLAGEARRGGP